MASADSGSVSNGVGYGEGCPLSSRLGGLGSFVSSPSGVRGRAPAENGFWRILKTTERSFLYLYDKNLRGTICSLLQILGVTCPPHHTPWSTPMNRTLATTCTQSSYRLSINVSPISRYYARHKVHLQVLGRPTAAVHQVWRDNTSSSSLTQFVSGLHETCWWAWLFTLKWHHNVGPAYTLYVVCVQ